MDLQLTDKVIFVAGSSRGIGRAIARTFLAEGARAVITGRQGESLSETTRALVAEFGAARVLTCPGDMSKKQVITSALEITVERWGHVDCLIANIGSGTAKAGWDLRDEDWTSAFDVNLWSSVRLVEAALPAMIEARHGSIILIGSITGAESTAAPLPYSAAKAALLNYGKNLARQVGPFGVRVNCVAPGNVLFPGGSWETKLAQNGEQVNRYIRNEVALGRFGTPEEIASVVAFLASDRAAFITGACLVADGGQTRGYMS